MATVGWVCVLALVLARQLVAIEGREWAVKVERRGREMKDLEAAADSLALSLGVANRGIVEPFADIFLFETPVSPEDHTSHPWRTADSQVHRLERSLGEHHDVVWVGRQDPLQRVKRGWGDGGQVEFEDPCFRQQWHLVNHKEVGNDVNVTGVWLDGVTGRGVVVAVVDDGLEWKNKDISSNYNAQGSYDFNSNDQDPSPNLKSYTDNSHGTKCAGLTAAVANDVCGVGVAYEAGISGIRMLDGTVTDILEAKSFIYHAHLNWIYSCSWGPEDNGKTVEGPGYVAVEALDLAIQKGRYGYGNIFVFASGNGGRVDDNCNFDGYANSVYTLTIGAVDEQNKMPWYAEQCPSMLAVTYSNGIGDRTIVTTDVSKHSGCTTKFTGTSAAAPIASGMIALVLQVRNCLSWRDVQSLVVYTSVKVDGKAEWVTNAAGFSHSEQHGFGLLDAYRLTRAAALWPLLPVMQTWTGESTTHHTIPTDGTELRLSMDVAPPFTLVSLEYVTVAVTITHLHRGALTISLISPQGTSSRLATTRKYDNSDKGLDGWTFMTVRFWGESPTGTWALVVTDNPSIGVDNPRVEGGVVKEWKLKIYGSNLTQDNIEHRKWIVEDAVSLDRRVWSARALPCPPLPAHPKELHLADIDNNGSVPMVTTEATPTKNMHGSYVHSTTWKTIAVVTTSVLIVVILLNLLAFWGCDGVKRVVVKGWRSVRDHAPSHSPVTTAVRFIKGRSEGEETLLLLNEAGDEGRRRNSCESDEVVLFVPVETRVEGDQSYCSEGEEVIFDATTGSGQSVSEDIRSQANHVTVGADHVTVGADLVTGGVLVGVVEPGEEESDSELNTSEGTPLMNGASCDHSKQSDWSSGQEVEAIS